VINPRKAGCRLAAFLIACVPLALAQGTYTQIDYPGAFSTFVTGTNTAGDVVGFFAWFGGPVYGFVLSQGVYTPIVGNGNDEVWPYSINDFGQVVGMTVGSTRGGFLYDINTKVFTTFKYPTEHNFTEPFSINNAGTIAGTIRVELPQRNFNVGFVLSGGVYEVIQQKSLVTTSVTGINNLGQIVGYGSTTGDYPNIGFILDEGKFQRLRIQPDQVNGINDAGVIVGSYRAPSATSGFVLPKGGAPQPLNFPGNIVETVAVSVNNLGVVSGWFSDNVGFASHGFLWTPPPDAAKK